MSLGSQAEPFRGLPHVGSLANGSRVYSVMDVLRSTSTEVVFANGSYIQVSNESFNVNISGGQTVIVQRDGGIITSGAGDVSISNTTVTKSRFDIG